MLALTIQAPAPSIHYIMGLLQLETPHSVVDPVTCEPVAAPLHARLTSMRRAPLDFDDSLTAGRVESTISELETAIKSAFPEVTRVFIEAQSWRAHQLNEESFRRIEEQERLHDGIGESGDE